MNFWRKKSDGFDWHHYVRTTILLRRQQRRARVDQIGRAAADHAQAAAKAAGGAAAHGVANAAATGWRATSAAWRATIAVTASAFTSSAYRTLSGNIAALVSPRLVQVSAVAVTAMALGWFAWGQSGPGGMAIVTGSLATKGKDIGVLEGRATALSGEMIRLNGRLLHLSGIEAPDGRQKCTRANTKTWQCGEAALAALGRLTRAALFRCMMDGGPDAAGRIEANCTVDGRDVAAELVKDGHVFSAATYFGGYAALESQARRLGNGVWSGTAERPTDYRAKLWSAAKSSAPDGCPIKGQIDGSRKTYLLPWSARYDNAVVRTNRGERWFCDEASAQAAGFRAALQRKISAR